MIALESPKIISLPIIFIILLGPKYIYIHIYQNKVSRKKYFKKFI